MVEGNYQATGPLMGMESTGDMHYEVDGNTLTGVLSILGSSYPVEEGKVDGNHFEHFCHAVTAMGKLKVEIKGEVNGDEITFKLKAPFIGTSDWKGHRV